MSNEKKYLRHAGGGRVVSPLQVSEWPMECTHDYQAVVEEEAGEPVNSYLRCRKCESGFFWSGDQRNRPKSYWTKLRQSAVQEFSKRPRELIRVSSCRYCDKCRDLFYGNVHTCIEESQRKKHGPDSGCACSACQPWLDKEQVK